MMPDEIKRCAWVDMKKPYYVAYHDTEWGVPVQDDRKHFEMLLLEGFQAGLSWDIILKKRPHFRDAFENFDPEALSKISDHTLEKLMQNPNIIRNRNKIWSVRTNARAFLDIQKKSGSFNTFIWEQINHKQIVNNWTDVDQIPAQSEISMSISKLLKKAGMKFVGPVIIYSYLQAVGLINDHVTSCWRRQSCML